MVVAEGLCLCRVFQKKDLREVSPSGQAGGSVRRQELGGSRGRKLEGVDCMWWVTS